MMDHLPVTCPYCETATDYQLVGKPTLSCGKCGYFCYGEEVRRLVKEERARLDLQIVLSAWERAKAQMRQEPEVIGNLIILPLCAWEDCDKGPQGGPAMTKPNSKYCSRDCSNRNARWRFAQRQKGRDK